MMIDQSMLIKWKMDAIGEKLCYTEVTWRKEVEMQESRVRVKLVVCPLLTQIF